MIGEYYNSKDKKIENININPAFRQNMGESKEIVPLPKSAPQRKSTFGHELSKINAPKQKENPMENGNETKFMYERYRTMELSRFMLMLIAQGMNILSYDLEFEQRDDYCNQIISYVIFVTTLILMVMTYITFHAYLDYEKSTKQVPKEANLMNTGRYKSLLFALFMYIIFPYPWTSGIKIEFTFIDESNGEERTIYYQLNEILTFFMLIRIVIAIKSILIFSRFAGARPNRVCNFYGCKSNSIFIVKCMMKKFPITVFTYLYIAAIFFFAFAIRICERPIVRESDNYWKEGILKAEEEGVNFYFGTHNWNNYSVALWCIFISLPTVGYGDRFPRTHLGRFVITFTAIMAAFLLSILVNALTSSLELDSLEKKSFTVMKKLKAKQVLNKAAIRSMTMTGRIRKKQKYGQVVEKKEWELLHSYAKEYRQQFIAYKNIKNEMSDYETLEKNFSLIKAQMKAQVATTDALMKCEEQIELYLDSYKPKYSTIDRANLSQSHHLGFNEGFELTDVQSKYYQKDQYHENTKNL